MSIIDSAEAMTFYLAVPFSLFVEFNFYIFGLDRTCARGRTIVVILIIICHLHIAQEYYQKSQTVCLHELILTTVISIIYSYKLQMSC